MRAVVVAVVLCFSGLSRGDTLVAGNPPLTDAMVDHTADFFEWALDTPFTQAQRDEWKTIVVSAWRKHDQNAISAVQQVLGLRDQLIRATPEVRAKVQPAVEAKLVANVRKSATDPTSRWFLAIYDGAHTSIASGAPALTRQQVDALAELLGFVLGEARTGKPIRPDRKDEDALAKTLAGHWSAMTDAQRRYIAQMPQAWAAVRMQWASLSEAEHEQYRAGWAKSLAPPKKPAKHGHQPSAAELMLEYRQMTMQYQMMSQMISMEGQANAIAMCNTGNCSYQYQWVP